MGSEAGLLLGSRAPLVFYFLGGAGGGARLSERMDSLHGKPLAAPLRTGRPCKTGPDFVLGSYQNLLIGLSGNGWVPLV